MKRKQAKAVGFSDLARGQCQFLTVKDWIPDPGANAIKEAFRPHGVIVEFEA